MKRSSSNNSTIGIVARGPGHETLLDRRAGVGVLIGVNHAAGLYPCDWWSFGDARSRLEAQPIGAPRWFTTRTAARQIGEAGVPVPEDALIWETFPDVLRNCWRLYSATAALVLAKELKAERVLCFGVVDELPAENEDPRWKTEREIWNEVVAWMGIPVVRA